MLIYCGYKSFTRDCRPRWLLEELGLAHEVVHVDVFAGDSRKPEYLAINPTGKVPFLRDGDVGIFESGAIVTYLADQYGVPKLAPGLTSPTRAEYLQWMFHVPAALDSPATRLFAYSYLYPSAEGSEERAKEAAEELAEVARVLEATLAGRSYLVGGAFSAADIMLGTALVWVDRSRALSAYPNLQGYLARLADRPAFKKTFAPTEREHLGHEGRG
jgi:glutathione S-transferase